MLITYIGYYCLAIAGLQVVALLGTAGKNLPKTTEKRFLRAFIWVSNPLFLGVAVLALKG